MLKPFVLFICLVVCRLSLAEDRILKISLGNLPVIAESVDKGLLPDLIKAFQRAYPEGKIEVEVVPFLRSIENLKAGKVDVHAPLLKDTRKTEEELGYGFSDANLWSVTFALYVNRKKPIDLKNPGKYQIETDAAHVDFFDFPVQPSSCLECSLKKLDIGRIDGFIFAALESDSIIEKLGLKNIKSYFYKTYEGKFVIPRGPEGRKINKLLSRLSKKVKANGDYQKALGPVLTYYKNWKPKR